MQFAGVLWYQGEQNAGCGGQPQIPFYACALPALISDWRGKFNNDKMPFGVFMLAAWSSDQPWFPLLRLVQVNTSIAVPHVATCSNLDAGNPVGGDVHSPYKQIPAHRCAAVMQNFLYDRTSAPYLGPRVVDVTVAAGPTGTTQVIHYFAPGSISPGPAGGAAVTLNTSASLCPGSFPKGACEAFALQRAAPNCSWVLSEPLGPVTAHLAGAGASTTLVLDLGDGGAVGGSRGYFGNWPLVQLYNGAGLPAEPWLRPAPGCPVPGASGELAAFDVAEHLYTDQQL